jgi:hypothetical protein
MFVKVWCCLLKKTRKNKTSKNYVWSNTFLFLKAIRIRIGSQHFTREKKEVKKIFLLLLLLLSDTSTKSVLVLRAALFYSERFFVFVYLFKQTFENFDEKL